ncbi:hypothetical protein TELCIR_22224, partial [Teladorsagia circumcincta]
MLPPKMKKKRRRPVSANGTEMPSARKALEHEDITPSLPIHDVQYQIMEALHKHETVVLIGETGCGKSTQVPQ